MTLTERALCEAIWSQSLAESETPREIRSCLDQINAETCLARDQLVQKLAQHGITPRQTILKSQFHAFDLHVSPQDVPFAIRIAADEGFVLAKAFSFGAAKALAQFEHQLAMMKEGADTLRVTLIWNDSAPLKLAPKLRPKLVDYAFARLPVWAWWAYPMVKPFRMISERLRRRSEADRLDGFLAQVNLGTPEALLHPLCKFAGIGQDDVLLDIGCGDARFLIDAVAATGCRGIGVERNRPLAQRGRDAIATAGLTHRIELHSRLATAEDLTSATVIFMFQPPGTLRTLLPWVLEQRSAKARVLVHEQAGMDFETPPDRMQALFGENALTVAYLWQALESKK